ncbi:hypothetical protein LF599_14590 [Pseudodesulfovibrio thermohalotolerans]|uniref:hypothetical protein n=1 Tax=Pseudodesulfovibrio thermohalotolerans TaxID=2880651 RepID=UPI002442AACC|nr:hypothetical protein [Pseudodesulfovibrio thermohalotolerans]WFS61883.1 hypothetical protein LF599_14590 [Pseudodesulfovibrio thermohalotolerans]
MRKWKIWTAFLAVFLAGTLTGVAGTGLFLKLRFAPPRDHVEFRTRMTDRVSDTLKRELDLTDKTADAIRAEVATTLDRLETVHAELRPKARSIIDDGIARVKNHLDDSQRTELDRLIRQNRQKPFSIFRLPPPPPPNFP